MNKKVAYFILVFLYNLAFPLYAATPTTCALSQLAGKWYGFKTNIAGLQSSKCSMDVNSKGKITGTCFDENYSYTSGSYPISSGEFYLGNSNTCALTFKLSLADGAVLVKGTGGLTPEKTSIQGYFSNNQGGFGPVNFVKVPSAVSVVIPITPSGGSWKGNKIEFNVASDGSKITSTGSALRYGSSVILTFPVTSSCGATSISLYMYSDYSILNGKFDVNDRDGLQLNGIFNSATTANGTYTYSYRDSSSNNCVNTGSGSWTVQR